MYELRIYSIAHGKMKWIVDRFKIHLPELFELYGIRLKGTWISLAGPTEGAFVYLLDYASLDERIAQWDAFYRDPRWPAVRALGAEDGEIVERFDIHFLRPQAGFALPETAFSATELTNLSLVEVPLAAKTQVDGFVRSLVEPMVRSRGGSLLLAADLVTGPRLPRIALLTHWNASSDLDAFRRAFTDGSVLAPGGRPSVWREESYLLVPA